VAEAAAPAVTPPKGRKPPKPPRPADDGWREFVTPEGVDLRLKVGDAGERFAALVVDVLIIGGLLIGLTIAACSAFAAGGKGGAELIAIVWLLGFFLLRNFYFTAFELSGRAATPGKRMMGLRVIARDGGRLTADAVFARNAMRELELFLPLTMLFARGQGVDAWLILLGAVWSGVFLLFPLFNRDRLRAGDLIAGTMVVKTPRKVLRPDLAEDGAMRLNGPGFTQAQLDAYGVKELHVLEEVLRGGDRRTMAAVARRIRTKIGWPEPAVETDADFLAAYYAGLRGRLEARLLFGKRRKDKFDVT
jgi:uncharacterized RDD family membrane protein YckC